MFDGENEFVATSVANGEDYQELYENGDFDSISESTVSFDEIGGGSGTVLGDIVDGDLTNLRVVDEL